MQTSIIRLYFYRSRKSTVSL